MIDNLTFTAYREVEYLPKNPLVMTYWIDEIPLNGTEVISINNPDLKMAFAPYLMYTYNTGFWIFKKVKSKIRYLNRDGTFTEESKKVAFTSREIALEAIDKHIKLMNPVAKNEKVFIQKFIKSTD